ncbi:MAG: hypothetical protein M5U07_14880 [Xanthobacteraceae bacterium]|nr:hypothetical protein [Xanthobacteraceae bacterium]
MMLRIDHRESDDIDIFLPDPQLLPYLDPKLRDFEFGIVPSDYRGDGARFVKLAFENIGEIDFIIGRALTHPPTTNWTIEGNRSDWKQSRKSLRRRSIIAVPTSSRATFSMLLPRHGVIGTRSLLS